MGAPASLRDHGLRVGDLEPGPGNAITDVPGVRVGHVTIVRDEPAVARTGVTVVEPGRAGGAGPPAGRRRRRGAQRRGGDDRLPAGRASGACSRRPST